MDRGGYFKYCKLLKVGVLGVIAFLTGYGLYSALCRVELHNQRVHFIAKGNQDREKKSDLLHWSKDGQRFPNNTHFKYKICPMFACKSCGLGNSIFQFASAYGIALHLNMTLLITENDIVCRIFQIKDNNIEIQKNRHVCDRMHIVAERFGCCSYDNRIRNLDPIRDYRLGLFLHSWKYFEGYENEIRRQLLFRKPLQDHVSKVLQDVIKKYKFKSRSDVIIIGIHVRRGDMTEKTARGYRVATLQYFEKAIQFFSLKFNSSILFVIATNDEFWVIQNIIRNKKLSNHLFELLQNNKPEIDFAILSNCDHVISSVGTFGWWAGWLANGITTYYKWPVKPNTFVGNQYSKNFSDFFYSDWIGIE